MPVQKAGMSAPLGSVPTSDLYTWRSGVESLSPGKSPCPGLYGDVIRHLAAESEVRDEGAADHSETRQRGRGRARKAPQP